MEKQINVVGAVVVLDGKILFVRRGSTGSLPGMWEFPGGKIEQGETHAMALERERFLRNSVARSLSVRKW